MPFVMLLLQTGPPVASAGAPSAEPIEVVLYSDFQCPFCAQFHQPIRQLQQGVDGLPVKVTFKNFPLGIHPNAQIAHQAAMAAAEQGKFWEMHDLLFGNQSAVRRDDLEAYARMLGLDIDQFRKDMDSERTKQQIQADVAEGEKLGVNGTPTFFINGRSYSGTRSFDQLKQIVQGDMRLKRALAEITDNLMSRGPAEAPITVEFFADLQSPVSRPALDAVNELSVRYPTQLRVQFRNFPLAFHPQAALAHEAAMTAARLGHFWEFATFCLTHQDSLREQDLIAYAGQLGLDEPQFAATLQEHRYLPRVEADVMAGLNRGIRGSPVIFVNTKRIDGVPNLQQLTHYVETELATSAAIKPKP